MCVKPASWQQQTIDYERTVRERKKKRDVERHFTPFYSSLRKFLSKDKQFDYFSAHLNNVSFVLIKTVQKIEHFSTYSWTSNKNEEFYPCHRSVFGLLGIGTLFEATNFKPRKSLSKCVSFDQNKYLLCCFFSICSFRIVTNRLKNICAIQIISKKSRSGHQWL